LLCTLSPAAKSLKWNDKSALLFYRKLVAELRNMGFEINLYNPCVANKMVAIGQLAALKTVCNLPWSVLLQGNN
jgi:hypothetical protein